MVRQAFIQAQKQAQSSTPIDRGILQRKCDKCRKKKPLLQREAAGPAPETVPPIVHKVLRTPGQPLDRETRAFMEPRFGHDFSRVRVHTDAKAAIASRSLNVAAYTFGRSIVFGAGQYAPTTPEGRHLLAHELTHTVQHRPTNIELLSMVQDSLPSSSTEQEAEYMAGSILYEPFPSRSIQRNVAAQIQPSGTPLYSPEQRRAMHEGRVTASQNDLALAARFSFQEGDIVFRLGSRQLAALIREPVTHGGIYLGGGLIHDMVGFGNRTAGVAAFYQEAADPSVVKVIRFTGPLNNLIIPRVVSNIQRRDFRLPTDPKPWNLFSSADDYRTASCLEYAHAQFLYAIQQLSGDSSVPASDQQTLRTTYFATGASTPRNLIQPNTLTLTGTPSPPPGGTGPSSSGTGASALTQLLLLGLAADLMADDVDPTVFQNRSEGQYQVHYPSGWLGWLVGPTHDTVTLRTFTYSSFVDSRQFFTVIR